MENLGMLMCLMENADGEGKSSFLYRHAGDLANSSGDEIYWPCGPDVEESIAGSPRSSGLLINSHCTPKIGI